MKKKLSAVFLGILTIFILGSFFFVQAKNDLEVNYPAVKGFQPESFELTKETSSFPEYVRYIYYFIIGISGIIAFVVLARAGFEHITSAGNPGKLQEAKERIIAAFIGLVILLGSWLIINTINPELTVLRLNPLESFSPELPAGIMACSKDPSGDLGSMATVWNEMRELKNPKISKRIRDKYIKNLYPVFQNIKKYCDSSIRSKNFDSPVSYVYSIPKIEGKDSKYYGAILYRGKGETGEKQIVASYAGLLGGGKLRKIGKAYSVTTFRVLPPEQQKYWKVCFYEHTNSNEEFKGIMRCFHKMANYKGGIIRDFSFPNSFHPESMRIWGDDIFVIVANSQATGDPNYEIFTKDEANFLSYDGLKKKDCGNGVKGWINWTIKRCVDVSDVSYVQIIAGHIF